MITSRNNNTMTKIYNRTSEKEKRRYLRKNMPKAEVIIWDKIKGKQIEGCKFRRQYSVAEFAIDFYAPELKLGIEIDGDSHYQKGVPEYDRERQEFIESTGIIFLRFTNDDVYDSLDGVLEIIRAKILVLRG